MAPLRDGHDEQREATKEQATYNQFCALRWSCMQDGVQQSQLGSVFRLEVSNHLSRPTIPRTDGLAEIFCRGCGRGEKYRRRQIFWREIVIKGGPGALDARWRLPLVVLFASSSIFIAISPSPSLSHIHLARSLARSAAWNWCAVVHVVERVTNVGQGQGLQVL